MFEIYSQYPSPLSIPRVFLLLLLLVVVVVVFFFVFLFFFQISQSICATPNFKSWIRPCRHIMNGNCKRYIHWLIERGKCQMWWESIARNISKTYGFYNGTLVASQIQAWFFLYISEPPGLNHTAVVFTVLAPLVYLDWFETPVIDSEMVCNGSSPVNDKQIRLTSHFLRKSIYLVLRSGCFGLNGLMQ